MHQSLSDALDDFDAPKDKTHPFAANSEDTVLYLQKIAQAADNAAISLNTYLSLPSVAQPKLISLLRQQSNLLTTIRSVECHPFFLNPFTSHTSQSFSLI